MLSDNRLEEVQNLDDVIGDGAHLRLYPQQHLQKAHIPIQLLMLGPEQVSDARLPRAYHDVSRPL